MFLNALHFVGHLSHFLQVDLNDKYAQSSQHLWKYCIVGVLMMLHESKLSSWGVVLQVASYLFHNVVYVLPCSGMYNLVYVLPCSGMYNLVYVLPCFGIALLFMCWGSFLKWLEHGPITPAPVFVFGMEWKGKSVSGEFWAFHTHSLIQWEEDVRICLFCLLVFLCSFKRNLGLCEEQQCSTLWKSRSWWSAAAQMRVASHRERVWGSDLGILTYLSRLEGGDKPKPQRRRRHYHGNGMFNSKHQGKPNWSTFQCCFCLSLTFRV
jgi:hypothetical protein